MPHYPFRHLLNTEHHRSPSTDTLICRDRSRTVRTQPSFPAAFAVSGKNIINTYEQADVIAGISVQSISVK